MERIIHEERDTLPEKGSNYQFYLIRFFDYFLAEFIDAELRANLFDDKKSRVTEECEIISGITNRCEHEVSELFPNGYQIVLK